MPFFDRENHRQPARLRHRLALIVHADAQHSAEQALRCAAYDAGVQLSRCEEQALGLPPVKYMLSGEFASSPHAASRLLQGLARHLDLSQLVLTRLETLGDMGMDSAGERAKAAAGISLQRPPNVSDRKPKCHDPRLSSTGIEKWKNHELACF